MIDPAEVGHVSMPVPQYPPSDESEGNDRTFNSELRDLVDSRLRPDLPPDDPTGSFTSTQSGLQASSANGQPSGSERRKRGQKKERHSALAQREMVRLLANEEAEAKSMRKYLRAALDRLDGETRRAQDAERRALEIAERFRVVNEARQSTQSELTRVTEELRLWRNQFESAQKEILRARDVFKELEEQRNSAESDATRYRTLARKLNEERMVNKAREEGRREGYEEGLRRGMEQGRSDAYGTRRRRDDVVVEDDDDDESSVTQQDDQDQRGQRQPDDMRSIMSESIPPLDIPTRVPLNNLSLRGGTQFHENFTPASTATRSLAPMQETPANDQPRMVRPPSSIHNRPPSVHHPENVVPPDNWIPALDASNNRISMPPPHEFVTRTGSPYSDNPPLPPTRTNFVHVPPNEPAMKDIFSKPPSIAESVQSSTAMSQYELLAPANVPAQQQKKEKAIPRLDRIEEVSSSLEYSPGFEKRMTPVPVTFPQASGSGDSDWGDGSHGSRSRKQSQQSLGHGSPRSRTLSQGQGQGQRQPDDARYSTSTIDNWRREAATNADPKQVS
ncbi:hypothetical protein EUX98_g5780 [Antrodiella citrinella]|uniref:Uncharacterized protein n=1 Tax=Antrodiella citrinella TaxID=2447956 RepID=A0A4V3XIA1_9APHY|nr:hypothetical protein EUX98_g5780 [Antrodiella citrinella]